jgi:hypothetical protein
MMMKASEIPVAEVAVVRTAMRRRVWDELRTFVLLHAGLLGLALALIGFSDGERENAAAILLSWLGLGLVAVWAMWDSLERSLDGELPPPLREAVGSTIVERATRSIFVVGYAAVMALAAWLLLHNP